MPRLGRQPLARSRASAVRLRCAGKARDQPLPSSTPAIVPYRPHSESQVAARRSGGDAVDAAGPSHRQHSVAAPPKYRSIAKVLQSEAQFTDWTARAALEADLTKRVRRHLPRTLADRVRVTEWRDGVLEIAATAGAIAATLRQRAADLREALARDGIECRDIHVRVQVAGVATSRERRAAQAWNSADAKPMFELGERLRDGPLKAAIARWSRRARGR